MENKEIETLEGTRKNIISWYPFESECSILEINTDCEQITNELKQKTSRIVSINENEIKNINEKFDYVVLIGLECVSGNIYELFGKIKDILKLNGKLLIATYNQFSIKNLSTKDGIDKILNGNEKSYTLNNVLQELKKTRV